MAKYARKNVKDRHSSVARGNARARNYITCSDDVEEGAEIFQALGHPKLAGERGIHFTENKTLNVLVSI